MLIRLRGTHADKTARLHILIRLQGYTGLSDCKDTQADQTARLHRLISLLIHMLNRLQG